VNSAHMLNVSKSVLPNVYAVTLPTTLIFRRHL